MIKTEEYMSSPVITATSKDTVEGVASLMDKHNIGSIVILDDLQIKGIVTERDVIRKVVAHHKDAKALTAADIMTPHVHTMPKDASLMEIAAEMKKYKMRRIIIIEDQAPIGIVTSRDLIGLLV